MIIRPSYAGQFRKHSHMMKRRSIASAAILRDGKVGIEVDAVRAWQCPVFDTGRQNKSARAALCQMSMIRLFMPFPRP